MGRHKVYVVGGMVTFIMLGLGLELYRMVSERGISGMVSKAQSDAERWVSPATTENMACHWLEVNGYKWEKGVSVDADNRPLHVLIVGRRQLRRGNYILGPQALSLEFHFGLDGRFAAVRAETWPFLLHEDR